MTPRHQVISLWPLALCVLSFAGCSRMYTLPDPPPQSEWQSVQKDETSTSPQETTRRFLDAKRSAIQCYAALADAKWSDALEWMSTDSRQFLLTHAADQNPLTALSTHQIILNGTTLSFDPVADIFIADLIDIRDTFADQKDDESDTRMILYAINAQEQARKLVFVLEDNRWKLQLSLPPAALLK